MANNALLLAAMLMDSVKKAYKDNPVAGLPVIQEVSSGKVLTLKNIAKQISDVTVGGRTRQLAFIAIGVNTEGRIWATTNYHAPVVYPLSYLLSKTLYKKIEKFRKGYKKDEKHKNSHYSQELKFNKTIHAETMLASLKDVLSLEHILIIDGKDEKVQNCPCCSHYLCIKGFSSEPHIERIENFPVPTINQILAVDYWVDALLKKFDFSLHVLKSDDVVPNKATVEAVLSAKTLFEAMFSLWPYTTHVGKEPDLEQVFSVIKQDYPFLLDNPDGLKDTYHLAKKLSSPEDKALDRSVLRTKVSTKRHPNTRWRLFDDERLVKAKNGRSLEPKDPNSPRSRRLVGYLNL